MKIIPSLRYLAICSILATFTACSHTHSDFDAMGNPVDSNANLNSAANSANLTEAQKMSLDDQQKYMQTKTLYFAFDSDKVAPADLPVLQAHANYLNTHPEAHLLIAGNTDARGSREYNVGLGQRRANSVADILKLDGARPEQLRTLSYEIGRASCRERV